MSLRAQIEALIYAADEPVTLDQLVDLLREDIVAAESQGASDQQSAPVHSAEPLRIQGEHSSDGSASFEEHESSTEEAEEPTEAETDEPSEPAEGELLNPKRAQREERKRHKALVRALVEELWSDYTDPDRGIEIREIAGGYRMSTKAEHHDLVRSFAKGNKPPIKLSLPALETLAVIAYKQPITAPEISEIRGVDTSGVLSSLLTRKLITTAGRKQVVGRPILYKTTKEFLLRFGLKDVSELPSMEEFEKLTSQSDLFEVEPEPASQPAEPAPADSVEAAEQDTSAIPEDYAESV